MKFEHLIWIIIFLVFVVSVIFKKVRAASKTGEKGIVKRLPEWKEKLNKFMSQILTAATKIERISHRQEYAHHPGIHSSPHYCVICNTIYTL